MDPVGSGERVQTALELTGCIISITKTISSNIIGPLPNKSDAPSEKVKKASGPLPKKSDAPSEKVKNSSGDLDDIEIRWSLLFT